MGSLKNSPASAVGSVHFKEKVVVVAGGTGALGRAVCRAFLEAGAFVVATYRDKAEEEALRVAAGPWGPRLGSGTVNVTDESSVKEFMDLAASTYRRIDILVNTVGAYAGGKNLWETETKTFDQMLALNLRSGFLLARAVLPWMIRQNSGSIVNIASKAGYGRSPGAAVYSASKAGALALFDSLAEEVKAHNIRVNSIVPSIFDTEANRKAMPGADFSKWPKPEEIARVIVFLCSEDAGIIHGAAIPVYGRT